MPNYQRSWLRGDLVAGVTVAAYLVPQVMAYATVAGLRPVAGRFPADEPCHPPGMPGRVSWPAVTPPRSGPGAGKHPHQAQRGQDSDGHVHGGYPANLAAFHDVGAYGQHQPAEAPAGVHAP